MVIEFWTLCNISVFVFSEFCCCYLQISPYGIVEMGGHSVCSEPSQLCIFEEVHNILDQVGWSDYFL